MIVENAGFGAANAAPIARRAFDYYLMGLYPSEEDLAAVRHHSPSWRTRWSSSMRSKASADGRATGICRVEETAREDVLRRPMACAMRWRHVAADASAVR
jgi:hypothetical protein